jgi:hypothetical protein
VSLEVHGHGQVCAAVVGVIEYGNLAATGVFSGNLYGILNGFCSRVEQR